jgi:large subunit ribosomal protein L35
MRWGLLSIRVTPFPKSRVISYNLGFQQSGKGGSRTMPKQKTHKATKKRFRITANGKVKHRQAGTSHLAIRKSHKRKRNLRGTATVADVEVKRIHMVLGKYSY